MKKLIAAVVLAAMPALGLAAGGHDAKLDKVSIDLSDKVSLQKGARTFINYCLSCHSAGYMRYNRVAKDLGIPEDQMTKNMVFTGAKVGDLMKAAMSPEDAKAAFNTVPPDLTLITRSRSADWFYTYMRSFYRDDKAVSGWNNTVFPNVAMPHVLYEMQGVQRPVYRTEKHEVTAEEGGKKVKKVVENKVFAGFELEKGGTMTKEQFDGAMRDLTNFMVYLGEPAKLERYRLGMYVLLFLLVFFVLAYLLKREYWKDIH